MKQCRDKQIKQHDQGLSSCAISLEGIGPSSAPGSRLVKRPGCFAQSGKNARRNPSEAAQPCRVTEKPIVELNEQRTIGTNVLRKKLDVRPIEENSAPADKGIAPRWTPPPW